VPAKFEFRLEPLLEHRKSIEEKKRRDYAVCRRAVDESKGEIGALADAHLWSMKQLVGAACTQSVADLRLRDAYLRSLKNAMNRERLRCEELNVACLRARDDLVAASRERRVVEKLKERRLRAFAAEEARRDELELDEANARRHEKCRA
jgi:flagellar FliJ protein